MATSVEEIKKKYYDLPPTRRAYFSLPDFHAVAAALPDHHLELIRGEIVISQRSPQQYFSIADFAAVAAALPEHRLELIKGEIVMLPPPDKAHQKAIDRVIKLFAYHIREIEALGCVIGGSNCFFEVPEQFRAEDGSGPSDIFPDASIHYEDYHDTTRHPAALLVVEVLSTSNRENLERDLILKQEIYAALEMPAYWIIDRRDQSVWVHTQPCAGQYTLREQMKGAQVLSAPGLEFLQITPARIFSE